MPSSVITRNRKRRIVNNADESDEEKRELNTEKLDLHTIAALWTPRILVKLLINK